MPISKQRATEIAAIAEKDIDTSEIPEAGEEFFKKAKLRLPTTAVEGRRRNGQICRAVRFGFLCANRRIDQDQCAGYASDAGGRL